VLIYYYVKVPQLPPDVTHQNGTVEVMEFLVDEGETVAAGYPLVRVKNWWAVIEFDAIDVGVVSKTFFSRGTSVKIGDPFAVVICEPERRPRTDDTCRLRIVERLRHKPTARVDA
jgi:pyruvate/2-oxoglutarate dehydrogenase complex dihydrolipoamide acyltransferase (E2) component